MTLNEAMKIAVADNPTPEQWKEAERTLVKHGRCPMCACDGEIGRLGRWTEGNASEYAGRACMECEEFFPCGPQPEYCDGPDTDASGCCYSDALPGF